MRRGLIVAWMVLLAWPAWAEAQGWPSYTMPLVARDGVFLAADHAGALFVTQRPTLYGGAAWIVQVEHVQSALHMSGVVTAFGPQATNVVDVGNAALQVNCIVGCGSGGTQAHITSVTHVAGRVMLASVAGTAVTLTGTSLDVNCTGGCTGGSSDAVNVFHQSTIRHVSSVTHVAGGVSLVSQSGVYATLTGTALNVANIAGQSGAWTIQAAHQGGAWSVSVSHISGQLHIASLHASGAFRAWRADSCGTTARTIVNTNTARRELWLTNMGTSNIYLGYGATGHVALTTGNGWPMHAASASTGLAYPVKLRDYQGPVACVTDLGSQQLGILEVLKN